jgi:tetratricopeptide (TPR) repeat protein
MMLGAAGLAVSHDELMREVYLPERRGSLQSDLISAARRRGLLAYPIAGFEELLGELSEGRPVLVLRNRGLAWPSLWHYEVVVGFDLSEGVLVLHSGDQPFRRLGLRVFERTWSRAEHWGLVVLPPDQLPVRADERRFLFAASGLERAHPAGAERAYGAALERWPDSAPAWLGLGNARAARGDLSGAERAFARGAELHPGMPQLFNNLAHVRARLGQREEALEAARRAVELGGAQVEAYRATLDEIERGD